MKAVDTRIESPSDYSLYTAEISSTIVKREDCIETIKVYFEDTAFLYVDGPKGVGKTTLLKHFFEEKKYDSISIFLNEDNYTTDKDIYKDLYIQSRVITGDFSRNDIEKDITISELSKALNTLQYFLKCNNKTIYFIFDGMNYIKGVSEKFLSDLFLMLPRIKNTKYLVSTNTDFDASNIPVRDYKTFSVNVLSRAEVSG